MAGYQNRNGYTGETVDVILKDYNDKSAAFSFTKLTANWDNYTGAGTKTLSREIELSYYERYSLVGTVIKFVDWGGTNIIFVQIISQRTSTLGNNTQLLGYFHNGVKSYSFLLEGTLEGSSFKSDTVTVTALS